MKSRTAFSKKDLVAILVCLFFVLMSIGAIDSTGRRRAKELVCLSNLHKWSVIFEMFTNNNNGNFPVGAAGEMTFLDGQWPVILHDYYEQEEAIRFCPMAKKTAEENGRNPFMAWGPFDGGVYTNIAASYGFNEWLCNRPSYYGGEYYENINDVKNPNNVPMFMDCLWYDVWVHAVDAPPEYDGSTVNLSGINEIRRVCLNRHNGAINCLFVDFSVRKVGLKELWTLKWSKNYDTSGPWTKAGGVQSEHWPEWMREFKEY